MGARTIGGLFAAVALSALAACNGVIFDPGAGPGGTGTPTPTTPRPGMTPNPDLCTAVAPSPVRRLSRAEYRATVRDLFPGVSVDYDLVSDPAEHGFENRAELLTPQPLLIEQYSDVAAEVAAQAIVDTASWMPCDPGVDGEDACARTFLSEIGERIFRRPLTADEVDRYSAFIAAESALADFETGVQLALEAMLQAPQFLYRMEVGDPAGASSLDGAVALSAWEVATRMSYLFWGSTPDDVLLDKARAGELSTPEEREAEARRLLDDPRAAGMLVEFHRQWLDFDQIADEPKDPDRYPEYTSALSDAIREESDRFVSRVMWQGEGTVEALLTSRETEVNDVLAELYGVPAPSGGGWAEATLEEAERAGILTRASFLTGRAHRLEGSPPLRGVFVYERILCRTPPSPPPDADLTEPASSSGSTAMTNRQLFEERTSPTACRGCHSTFDGLGNAFEHYDAIGRFRAVDNGQPVDPTGTFSADGETWTIDDAIDLSGHLATSDEALGCVAGHWFDYVSGQQSSAEDQCRVAAVYDAFSASGGDIRELLVAFATRPELAHRSAYEVGR
jgi:hypothetical protein